MDTRRAVWVVWSVGVFAYLVAVLQRSSLGVAGLEATARFQATPAVLSAFVVLQLLVYTTLQVPVGLLIDRFGARRLIMVGALIMSIGQLLLAFVATLPAAFLARFLVGAGDALTFISVLRVVNAWFPAKRAPLMTQLTALLGQLGQVLSAIPLVALLRGFGWSAAFASAAGLGLLALVLVIAVVRDQPHGSPSPHATVRFRQVVKGLREAWSHPGTRLGFWSHMGTQFSGMVFALLWGVPFLVAAQGMTAPAASALLTLFVVVGLVAAPVIGVLTARFPMRRSWLVLTVIGATATMWTVVLALPQPVPGWVLVLLVVVLAVGGPGSVVGFDYARQFNPQGRQGTAVGIVNVGGFSASVVVVFAVGLLLNLVGGRHGYTAEAFRVAWCAQYLVWFVAVLGVLRNRRRTRRRLAQEGVEIPSLRESWARRRAARSAEPVS